MLGVQANTDEPTMKIVALNRVLRGWASYYKTVNSYKQFRTGDFLAQRLFCLWYCRKYKMGVRKYLSQVVRNGRVAIPRGHGWAELYRMASNRSMHTPMNHKLVWKYRAITNPYIRREYNTTVENEESAFTDVPDVQPIPARYNDGIYSGNRLLALERDGWKCTQCGSQENLQAHHIEPVPKDQFDPIVIHRVENLRTLCAACHLRGSPTSSRRDVGSS
jgi:hypothetical protein